MAAIKQCQLIGRSGIAFSGSLNFYLSTFRVPLKRDSAPNDCEKERATVLSPTRCGVRLWFARLIRAIVSLLIRETVHCF